MKKMMITLLAAAAMLIAVPETMAGHHGHQRDKGNNGLKIAAGIVNLVKNIVAPAPQVVYTPPAAIVPPPPPRHEYRRPAPPKPHHKPAKPNKPQPKKHNKRGDHRR